MTTNRTKKMNSLSSSKWKKWLRNNKSNSIFGFVILLLSLTIFVTNCSLGTCNEAAIRAFSKYTTKHNIVYKSYECGNAPEENDKIICTYQSAKDGKIYTLMCGYDRIFENTCYPVDRIW